VTIPPESLPASYQAPSFRFSLLENLLGVKRQGKPPGTGGD
jgi:hypothetical protein